MKTTRCVTEAVQPSYTAECKPWSVNARLLSEWHLSHGIYF